VNKADPEVDENELEKLEKEEEAKQSPERKEPSLNVDTAITKKKSDNDADNNKNTNKAMIAAIMKIYWMMIQAVRAVIPTATVGLEVMVDTRRVVKERKRVTRRDIRPGTTWGLIENEAHEAITQRPLGR